MPLRRFDLFAALDDAESAELSELLVERPWAAGSTLFERGQPATGFYLIESGRIKVFILSPDGREQILSIFGPGQSFAEAAVFAGINYPASAEVVEDAVVRFVGRQVMLEAIRKTPELAFKLVSSLSSKLRTLVAMVEDLTLRDARGRVCRYLLGLDSENGNGGVVTLPVRQTLVARWLGITGETLSRTLHTLADEGSLEIVKPKMLRLLNPERLQELAGPTV